MGYYLKLPDKRQVDVKLQHDHAATLLTAFPKWEEIPQDQYLIAIAHNGAFDAALVVIDVHDYHRVSPNPRDDRRISYLLLDKGRAQVLCPDLPCGPDMG